MSATISAVILENTLPAGADPSTASLQAVVQHSSIFVQDLLSGADVEFEAEITVTLRPSCVQITDGFQMNWRSFFVENLPAFNNMNLRLNKKSAEERKQPVAAAVQIPAAAAAVQCVLPVDTQIQFPVSYTNGKGVVASASPSLHHPAAVPQAPTSSMNGASVSAPPSAAASSTPSIAAAPALVPTLSKAVMDKINTEYVVRGGHAFAKPGGVHHRDNFCSICTSLEHSYETHYKLEKGTVMCAYGDIKCVHGTKCYHAHTNAQRNRAKAALATPEFKYNQENMCYLPVADVKNPGYYIFSGCGSTSHTHKNRKGVCLSI